MRFLTFTLLGALCACNTRGPIRLQPTLEEARPLINPLRMNDPRAVTQLLGGFYGVEGDTWRWTTTHFSVALPAPSTARTSGASLVVKLTFPDVSFNALRNITLSCRLADAQLASETFRTTGEHEYRREIPAPVFSRDVVMADFSLDKFLRRPGTDRELGIIVTEIRLDPK